MCVGTQPLWFSDKLTLADLVTDYNQGPIWRVTILIQDNDYLQISPL